MVQSPALLIQSYHPRGPSATMEGQLLQDEWKWLHTHILSNRVYDQISLQDCRYLCEHFHYWRNPVKGEKGHDALCEFYKAVPD